MRKVLFSKKALIRLFLALILLVAGFFLALWLLSASSYEMAGDINDSSYLIYTGDEAISRELQLPHGTYRVSVSTIPFYTDITEDPKVDVYITDGIQTISRTFHLKDLKNGEPDKMDIFSFRFNRMSDNVRIILEGSGLNADNNITLFNCTQADEEALNEEALNEEASMEPFFSTEIFSCPPFKLLTFTLLCFAGLYILIFTSIRLIVGHIRKKDYKPFIILLIVSAALSVAVISVKDELVFEDTRPGKEIQVDSDIVVTQKLYLKNTSDIVVYYHVNHEFPTKAVMDITLRQGERKTDTVVSLSETSSYMAMFAHVNTKNMKNGLAELTIRGRDLEDIGSFGIYTSDIKGINTVVPNVFINGEEIAGQHLSLRYKYFNPFSTLLIFCFFMILSTIIWSCWHIIPDDMKREPAMIMALLIIIIELPANRYFMLNLDPWSSTSWLFSYKFGLFGKALPGTVLQVLYKIFTGSAYIASEDLRYIIFGIFMIYCFAVIMWLRNILKNTESGYKDPVRSFITIFILSPVFVSFYTDHMVIARPEVLINICFIISCSLIVSERFLMLLPILSAICILSHQGIIFTILPALLMLMIFEWICNGNRKFCAPVITTFTVSGLLAWYIQFKGKINGYTLDQVISDIRSRSDASIMEMFIFGENYIDHGTFTDYYKTELVNERIVLLFITTLLILIPLLLILFSVWIVSFRTTDNKLRKAGYILFALCPVIELYTFTANVTDQGRYIYQTLLAVFFAIFVLIRKNDQDVLKALKTSEDKLKNKLGNSWPWIFGGFFMCLGKFDYFMGLKVSKELSRLADVALKMVAY